MTRAEMLAGLAVVAYTDFRFQVSGALFSYAPGESSAPPLAGADVYFKRAQNSKGAVSRPDAAGWLGPTVTDTAGRFLFLDIPMGNWTLFACVGSNVVWQQDFTASPQPLQPIVVPVHDPRTTIVFYREGIDASRMASLLRNLGYRNVLVRPGTQRATNIVRFGSRVSLSDVKLFAASLIVGGISLRAVRRFSQDTDVNANVIETGTDPSLKTHVLAVREVNGAVDFGRGSPGELPLTVSATEEALIESNLRAIPSCPNAMMQQRQMR